MARFHKMADGTVRSCDGCDRCLTSDRAVPSASEILDFAYRANEIHDGVNWVENNTGAVVTRLFADGVSVSMRDAGRRPSVPMPDLVKVTNLDPSDKAKARQRARSKATGSLPEARYSAHLLATKSNRAPIWARRWSKRGQFSLPTTTPSSRLVAGKSRQYRDAAGRPQRIGTAGDVANLMKPGY